MIVESVLIFFTSFWCFEMITFVYDLFTAEEEKVPEPKKVILRKVPPKGLPNMNRKRYNAKKAKKYVNFQSIQEEIFSDKSSGSENKET